MNAGWEVEGYQLRFPTGAHPRGPQPLQHLSHHAVDRTVRTRAQQRIQHTGRLAQQRVELREVGVVRRQGVRNVVVMQRLPRRVVLGPRFEEVDMNAGAHLLQVERGHDAVATVVAGTAQREDQSILDDAQRHPCFLRGRQAGLVHQLIDVCSARDGLGFELPHLGGGDEFHGNLPNARSLATSRSRASAWSCSGCSCAHTTTATANASRWLNEISIASRPIVSARSAAPP